MAAPLPTGDQFFATPPPAPGATGLPTGDQFFAAPTAPQPQSGSAFDALWGSLSTAGGRILHSAGMGLADAWGAEPLGLSPDAEAGLKKAGVFNDFKDSHTSLLKSANEALIRPAASAADLAIRRGFGIPALLAGAGSALEQTEKEIEGEHPNLVQRVVGGALGATGEIAHGTAEGAFAGHFGEVPAAAARFREVPEASAPLATEAAKARSTGVLGEGEAGFYGAAPLTPENLAARADAAHEAGLDATPEPLAPAPDIHVLARRVDPETFEQFDALAAERDAHRQALTALNAEREASPEAVAARGEIDTILGKVNGVEDRLTKAAAGRLADAQARLDAILRTDTPEQAAIRGKLMDADFAMRDLAPAVSEAYRRAADMAPHLAETPQAPAGEPMLPGEQPPRPPGEDAIAEPEPPGAPEHVAPVVVQASSEAAGIAPPDVTGEALGAGTKVAETPEKSSGSRYGNLRAIEGTGELETRSLSQGVEAKAIEDGLAATFGDLPEYRTLSMKDQAAKAQALVDADHESAKAIAMGDKAPPKGLLPESVYVAVEKRALAEGDVDTLQRLATRSKLTTSATTMGQRIRTLGERDQASPVGAIQEVQAAREADLAKRNVDVAAAKRETVAEIKAEVRKAATVKADAWRDFLKSIECSE